MRSVPAKAQTSINNVERGRWKLVSSRSATLKPKAGFDEQRRLPRPCAHPAALGRRGLDQAQRVVPTATTRPPPARQASIASAASAPISAAFGMHDMILDPLRLYRQEGAGADVQRDRRAADPRRIERRQQLGREVQPGGRRRYRARPRGEDGLVIRPIARIGCGVECTAATAPLRGRPGFPPWPRACSRSRAATRLPGSCS